MSEKKIISSFINPKWIPVVILMIIPVINFFALIFFLTTTLPALLRANKKLKELEANGLLAKAAAELIGTNKKSFIKGKIVLTDSFVFCKGNGFMFSYDEILWTYKHRQTTTFLFIPISVTDSLYLATKKMNPRLVVSMGKDKKDTIKSAIIEIYNHNNNCLVGYTNETIAKYKELKKA